MLPDWLVATLLGFIEGLTEFIPVSSTGHLLIAQRWLPPQSDLFNIVIQCGAVLAVLPLFTERLAMLGRWREPQSRDLLTKILVAFLITAVGGVILDKLDFQLPEETGPVAWALIVGGIAFIVVERWLRGRVQLDSISWVIVIAVACAQLLAAIFPGTSRSGATILLALIFGANRRLATEFSFLVGIPTILAAGSWKTLKYFKDPPVGGVSENWAMLGLGALVAAIVSFVAVKWLLRYVQTHTFVGFGVYRLVLGGILLLLAILLPR